MAADTQNIFNPPCLSGSRKMIITFITTLFIVIIALCCWMSMASAKHVASMTSAESMLYKDPNQPVSYRIKDLMSKMTLEETIDQMIQIERTEATPDVMNKGVLSGGGSVPAPRASPEAWIDMVNAIQNASLSTRLGIPMIYGIDAVHGNNNVYKATIFPHNVGLGATRDSELIKRIGAATALEVRATGIPYAFAPCIAL